jgi:ankyrin repeat protein
MPGTQASSPAGGSSAPLAATKQHLNLQQACVGQHHAAALALCKTLEAAAADAPDGVSQRALAHAADAAGWCPLLWAARWGWDDVLSHCLDAQLTSSPNTPRLHSSGNTALHLAALHNQLGAVRVLLRALQQHTPSATPAAAPVPGVDVANANGDTPLMFALSAGNLGAAAALLNVSGGSLSTPIFAAPALLTPLRCPLLLCPQAGACPAAANASGISPLLAAAGHGHTPCLQLLLRHAGAAAPQLVAAKDEHGRTGLHFAAASGV